MPMVLHLEREKNNNVEGVASKHSIFDEKISKRNTAIPRTSH